MKSASSTTPSTSGRFAILRGTLLCGLLGGLLSACGAGSGTTTTTGVTPPASQFSIGGTLSGLAAASTLTLSNGGDSIDVSANGAFSFPTKLASGAIYQVTLTNPPGHTCTLGNAQATVANADVSTVQVSCLPFLLAGAQSLIQHLTSIAADQAGNVFVADKESQVILKITPAGVTSVFAGVRGIVGSADGPGASASFHLNMLSALLVDRDGNLIVSDTCNGTVRKITPDGIVSTLAGKQGNYCPQDVNAAFPPDAVDGVGSDAIFGGIGRLAQDINGDLLMVDFSRRIRRITPQGAVSSIGWGEVPVPPGTPRNTLSSISDFAVDAVGDIYATDTGTRVWKISGGIAAVFSGARLNSGVPVDGEGTAARFGSPRSIRLGADGNFYISDFRQIRKMTPQGVVTTIAGNYTTPGTTDGTGSAAQLNGAGPLTIDANGDILVGDRTANIIRRVTPTGVVTTLAATPITDGYADGTAGAARLSQSRYVTADANGNVYTTDAIQHVVRKISPAGVVSLFAGTPGVTGNTDGPGTNATFNTPQAIASDRAGNLYVGEILIPTDPTEPGYLQIRKISPTGVVSTLPRIDNDDTVRDTSANSLIALAVDANGNIAIARGEAVYRLAPDGSLSTLVYPYMIRDYLHISNDNFSDFFFPQGLVYDASGNLYISDTAHVVVHKLGTDGVLSTFAGTPTAEGILDGPVGTGTLGFFELDSLTIDASGNVYLSGQGRLRKISPAGVLSTPTLPWGNPQLQGLAVGNGILFGITHFAVQQTAVQ
jgi:sugar lactone lactonase YvrE